MNDPISKQEVLDLIHTERQALESVLKRMSKGQMTQPGLVNNWSVKDILAHIAAWEQRMIRWLEESFRGERPDRPAPGMTWDDLDQLNEQIYIENKDKGLEQVLAEFDRSYQEALKVIERMTEEDLFEGNRFEWRKGDPMWHMVAGNTWWHYKEHREAINIGMSEE